jgi:hypothetical protein
MSDLPFRTFEKGQICPSSLACRALAAMPIGTSQLLTPDYAFWAEVSIRQLAPNDANTVIDAVQCGELKANYYGRGELWVSRNELKDRNGPMTDVDGKYVKSRIPPHGILRLIHDCNRFGVLDYGF